MYRRPWYVRLSANRRRFMRHLPSIAAALLFSMLPVAMLLHLGNTDTSGPVGCVPCPAMSSCHHAEHSAPDPGSIVSGADPELCVEEI
jgi:hypothetical protein